MEENETKKTPLLEKVKEQVEEQIECIVDDKVQPDNVDYLYRLVDIHKDLENEDYWNTKKEDIQMRYGNYGRGSYNEGSYGRDSYNGYGESGSYGRRGRERDSRGRYKGGRGSGRYRGHEMMDEMYEQYGNYSEGREQYSRGNYGAKEDTMKSLEYMLESMVDFVEMLKEEASSQEEMELIKHYTKKISEM